MVVTPQQFLDQRAAVRGAGNPQRMPVTLWEELVRSGEPAWAAAQRYGGSPEGPAGWCFDRFGMTRTRLPDGRIVCIAGEHEDYYDPDFFIYNDVIVIRPDGGIEIYGYSPNIFAPTDFHTATLVGGAIYIIGRLGYHGQRGGRSTPVYRLDVRSMRMRPVVAGGVDPGWIFKHRAELAPDGISIRVSGGKVIASDVGGKEAQDVSASVFSLDTAREVWMPADGVVPTLPISRQSFALPGWVPPKSLKKAQELRDAIVRAAAPDHPLFCEDFWPMAEHERLLCLVLQMLDGSGRWALCDGPSYTGREKTPLTVTFHPSFHSLARAARQVDESES